MGPMKTTVRVRAIKSLKPILAMRFWSPDARSGRFFQVVKTRLFRQVSEFFYGRVSTTWFVVDGLNLTK